MAFPTGLFWHGRGKIVKKGRLSSPDIFDKSRIKYTTDKQYIYILALVGRKVCFSPHFTEKQIHGMHRENIDQFRTGRKTCQERDKNWQEDGLAG